MKINKKIIIRAVIAVIIIFGIPIALILGLQQMETAHIESVANKFKPDSSWTLRDSRVEPAQIICIGDVACPSVSKVWQLRSPINNAEQFQKIATINSLKMNLLDECFYTVGYDGRQDSRSCDASIVIDGFRVQLSYYGSTTPLQISLIIERERR